MKPNIIKGASNERFFYDYWISRLKIFLELADCYKAKNGRIIHSLLYFCSRRLHIYGPIYQ